MRGNLTTLLALPLANAVLLVVSYSFCNTSLPLASTRWVWFMFSVLCSLFSVLCSLFSVLTNAVNKSQCHEEKIFLGKPRIELGLLGEASMLPLCYAAPLWSLWRVLIVSIFHRTSSETLQSFLKERLRCFGRRLPLHQDLPDLENWWNRKVGLVLEEPEAANGNEGKNYSFLKFGLTTGSFVNDLSYKCLMCNRS